MTMGDESKRTDAARSTEDPLSKEETKGVPGTGAKKEQRPSQAKSSPPKSTKRAGSSAKKHRKNNVRKFRMERMMSKAELARRAGISTLTVDRVERGMNCRMDTKRKILEALELKPSDRKMVFPDDD